MPQKGRLSPLGAQYILKKEGYVMKKIALGVALAGIGVAGTAQGAVYIAPPDVDQYKQKTDQSFYDLYQNPNSPMNVNPQAKRYLNNFSTDQKALEGYVLPSLRGAFIQGAHIPRGEATVVIAGVPFYLRTGDNGEIFVQRRGGPFRAKRGLSGFAEVSKPLGKPKCVSGGKFGCTEKRLKQRDIYFNAVSGDYLVRDSELRQTRSCGKYGCSGWSIPSFVRLLDVKKGNVPIATAIKEGRYVVSEDREIRASGRVLRDVLKVGHRGRGKWF